MDIPESIGAYKREVIMEYTTDGTDEWSYTRKEHLTRCRDCKVLRQLRLSHIRGLSA